MYYIIIGILATFLTWLLDYNLVDDPKGGCWTLSFWKDELKPWLLYFILLCVLGWAVDALGIRYPTRTTVTTQQLTKIKPEDSTYIKVNNNTKGYFNVVYATKSKNRDTKLQTVTAKRIKFVNADKPTVAIKYHKMVREYRVHHLLPAKRPRVTTTNLPDKKVASYTFKLPKEALGQVNLKD